MSEIRRDPITDRWVIISTDHPYGPGDFELEHKPMLLPRTCPLCPGNEKLTPPEITVRPHSASRGSSSPWTMRVIPNKFPALRVEGNLDRVGLGIYDMMNGVGAHEVIIETPDHTRTLSDFRSEEMLQLLELFRERSNDLRKDKRFQYLLIFKNSGESAGASLSHSHSQLIALPIVPKRVLEEIKQAEHYFRDKERCLFCDVIQQEMSERERIVLQTDQMICFAPFASRFPFEMWIFPKRHLSDFMETPSEILKSAGEMLQRVLARMKSVLKDPSYNFLIHTSPLEAAPQQEYHWHIELMPRLTRIAGVEWGSGFYINPTPPEEAAKCLRGEKVGTESIT